MVIGLNTYIQNEHPRQTGMIRKQRKIPSGIKTSGERESEGAASKSVGKVTYVGNSG